MSDITSLIMDDHEWFRRQFARLDDARAEADLAAIWEPLAARLDLHAEAEETIFYPRLLKRGEQDPQEETEDAIRDHNKIRDGVAEAARHDVGSPAWFEAVGETRTENSEHLAEEEDQGLPDFRKHASLELRAQLADEWLRFYADHPGGRGISGEDVDPEGYVKDHT
ncbi:MAG: hemerythrin domain-containing protein [Actinomycetota bacterium]|nr:hemerythrin domain-containing protein [Actinomycetota bacterium]